MSAESGSGEQGGFEQHYPVQDTASIWMRGSLPSLLDDEVAMQKLDELLAHAQNLLSERPHPEYIPSEPGSELLLESEEMHMRLSLTPHVIHARNLMKRKVERVASGQTTLEQEYGFPSDQEELVLFFRRRSEKKLEAARDEYTSLGEQPKPLPLADHVRFRTLGRYLASRYDLPEHLHWMGPGFVDEWPTGQPPVESQGAQ